MPLVDVTFVRDLGNLPVSAVLADGKVSVFFPAAEARLREWVGDDAYDDAGAASPSDAKRASALKDAEGFLVMAEGMPSWNKAMAGAGVLKTKTLGTQGGDISLLTPEEIQNEVQTFVDKAERRAKPYLLGSSLGFSRIEADFESE